MCGLAGAFAADNTHTLERNIVLQMLAAVRHRGPDGCGIYMGTGAALGAVRLAITDVPHGQQPFVSSCGGIICCYNGEIFNFSDLRDELRNMGYSFRTNCDGEVIANLFSHAGEDGLRRLEGQYAFALWDRKERIGILGRDEFGVLPLFFVPGRDQFVFASSLAAFLEVPGLHFDVDETALAETCTFWSPIGRSTFLKQARSVLPGEIIRVAKGLWTSQTRRFQVPSNASLRRSKPASDAAIHELMNKVVRLRIPKEVKFGVYLSGGVDSALLAAIAKEQVGSCVALSVTFPGSARNEGPQQREIAEALGLQHLTVACGQADIAEHFESAVKHAEVPLFRTAPVGTYLLSRLAQSEGIKVILTGEGADEVFWGYDIYRSIAVINKIRAAGLSEAVLTKQEILDWQTRDPFARPLAESERSDEDPLLSQILAGTSPRFGPHMLRWQNTSALLHFLRKDLRNDISLAGSCRRLDLTLPSDYSDYDDLCRGALLDFNTLLAGYLLSSQGDRMAMAHAVELRVPYLDRALVRAVWGTRKFRRILKNTTKTVLRNALKTRLGGSTSSRPKKAYAAMDLDLRDNDVWQRMHQHFARETIDKHGLFDPEAVCQAIQARRQSDSYCDDFISPVALIASAHILAQHFSDLAIRASRVKQSDLVPEREISDPRP